MNIKSLKRALKQSHIISTAFYYGRQCAAHRSAGKRGSDVIVHQSPNAPCRMRVAVICDEMTWRNCISVFSETFFLTPNNWKETLHTYKPQLLFCESAWEGIDAYRYIWCGGIFRNHRVLYEHRGALLGILKDCREAQIPTVFWNKGIRPTLAIRFATSRIRPFALTISSPRPRNALKRIAHAATKACM